MCGEKALRYLLDIPKTMPPTILNCTQPHRTFGPGHLDHRRLLKICLLLMKQHLFKKKSIFQIDYDKDSYVYLDTRPSGAAKSRSMSCKREPDMSSHGLVLEDYWMNRGCRIPHRNHDSDVCANRFARSLSCMCDSAVIADQRMFIVYIRNWTEHHEVNLQLFHDSVSSRMVQFYQQSNHRALSLAANQC